MTQCGATNRRIARVTHYAAIARKQAVRAERAFEIVDGTVLRPEFESKLLGLLAECNSSGQELINTLNSGALDRLNDAQLATSADGLMKTHFMVELLLKSCTTLRFKRKTEFDGALAVLSGISDRIASIREGIELSFSDEFRTSMIAAAEELHNQRATPVQ